MKEKSLNREKIMRFSPDFSNCEALMRVLTTGYLHYASKIGPTNRTTS